MFITSRRRGGSRGAQSPQRTKSANTNFFGYRRENGRIGIRNHVIILPLDDLSNAAPRRSPTTSRARWRCRTPMGGCQFGEDLELHFRTPHRHRRQPERRRLRRHRHRARLDRTRRRRYQEDRQPVAGFAIEGNGDIMTIAKASRQAKDFLHWASEIQRTDCAIDELFISAKCGESDTTSGLASCPTVGDLIDSSTRSARRPASARPRKSPAPKRLRQPASTKQVADKFMRAFSDYQAMIDRYKTNDLSESQPTKGNIAGGLTTIRGEGVRQSAEDRQEDEIYRRAEPAEAPKKGPGLYFMDTSSAAAECVSCRRRRVSSSISSDRPGNVIATRSSR